MPPRPGAPVPRPVRELPPVVLVREHGWEAVLRARRQGQLRRVGVGVYVAASAPREHDALARMVGLHRRLDGEHCFSHESAAVLWGLPVLRTPSVTSIYQAARASSRSDPLVARRPGLADVDVCRIAGLPVTTLLRTVVDCLRACPPAAGLVVADAALRAGADPAALGASLDALGGRPGAARARTVLRHADGGAESAPESVTRLILLGAGFPAPTTQLRVPTRLGPRWADLGWEEWRLLLEYDGRSKYATGEDLRREKDRQDLMAEERWHVLRVVDRDLSARSAFVDRVLRHVPRGVRLRPVPLFAEPIADVLGRRAG